jgi:hypothetical protein
MTEKSNTRTAREALIIEALGDIGDLIKRIEKLQALTAPFLAALEKTQMDAIAVIEQHASNQQSEFRVFAEQEGRAFEEKLQASMEKAAKHLENAGRRMASELERPAGLSLWAQISIALAIAGLTSVMSICGTYWMFGRELSAQASVGRAVMTVWNELDDKTKVRIEQEY